MNTLIEAKNTPGIDMTKIIAIEKKAAAHDEPPPSENTVINKEDSTPEPVLAQTAQREMFKFHSPSDCRGFVPPDGHILIGDCHIQRGHMAFIGGAPGVGKSRAATALAIAGATKSSWFGLPVHKKFKTAILQAENGLYRLKMEFKELNDPALDEFIRISEPPTYGMAFDDPEFQKQLADWLTDFAPDLVVLDPWNAIVRDDNQRAYRAGLDAIHNAFPKGDKKPAIVIVCHTRKTNERKSGRDLLQELSGSHIIASAARCVFVMQTVSNDSKDNRVIWECTKNNDGLHGERSVWYRCNGLFKPCTDIGLSELDPPVGNRPKPISEDDMDRLFDNGSRKLKRTDAVNELQELTGKRQSSCYTALSIGGQFSGKLAESDGLLVWNP